MTEFTIKLLGGFRVVDRSGQAVSVPGAKQQALLAYLALNAGKPIRRDRLMTLLWGERFDEQARQSLRQALTKIRKLAPDGLQLLQTDGDTITFSADLVVVDAIEFERDADNEAADACERAAALYEGELLDGLIAKETTFEEWVSGERARLSALACAVLERAARLQQSGGNADAAITTAQRLVKLDPLRESSHRLLMQIFAETGQRTAALKQYTACAAILSVELGVEPDTETKRLLNTIRQPGPGQEPAAESGPAAATVTHQPALAVLPISHRSDDAEAATLARGMSEELVAALTGHRWLSIMRRFTGDAPPEQLFGVAREEGADYGLEGSIRMRSGRFRLNIQLIDLRTGRYIWAQRYERELDDVFAAEDEIVREIAGTVEPEIAAAESRHAREKDEANLDAWDYYHLGLAAQYEFSRASNLEAQRLFRKAIAVDSGLAAAHARLAYAMVLGAIYFDATPVETILEEALQLARAAARLDDQDAVAHFAIGRTLLARGDYEPSLRELEAALALNPTFAQAHCALGNSLAYAGRLDEAIPCFQEAMRISPHDPYRWAFLTYGAMAFLFRSDFESAAQWAYNAVRVPNAHYGAHVALVAALGHLGRAEEATSVIGELLALRPGFSCRIARQRLFYLKDQRQVELYIDGLRRAGLPE